MPPDNCLFTEIYLRKNLLLLLLLDLLMKVRRDILDPFSCKKETKQPKERGSFPNVPMRYYLMACYQETSIWIKL